MNSEQVRDKFKDNPKLKSLVDWLIMNQVETRPRWYIRFLAPLYQHRGKHSVIHRSVRMDTPPYRQFRLGDYSVVESFACINNAVGDVIIGDYTRVGLHNTIIGPVTIGNHVNMAQGITVTAVQMLQALSTIGNEGTVIKPYLIKKIVDQDGNVVFEGKTLKDDKSGLVTEVQKKIKSKRGDEYYSKTPNRLGNLRERMKESIAIAKKYVQ